MFCTASRTRLPEVLRFAAQKARSTHSNDLALFLLQAPCQLTCHLINGLFIGKLEVIYILHGGQSLHEITDLFSNLYLQINTDIHI
jgi:hypothetical protein